MADNDIMLNERESRLAVVLFEIMKPQLEKLIISKVALQVALHLDNIKDEKSSDFDINDHTGDIEDIVSDWIQYNLTLTTTVD